MQDISLNLRAHHLRTHPRRYLWAAIILFGMMITGVSIDVMVPSLPAMTENFRAETSLVQLSVTVFLIGLGLFQLVAGAVSDSLGRKTPLTAAVILYVITNLLAAFSSNIYQLLLLRFLQGVAVAFSAVSMRAMIPDLFAGYAFKKMANYMVMVWSIGPIIAPAIGGYLQVYFNWPGTFYFLALYGSLLLILVSCFVPETLTKKTTFKLNSILINTQLLLANKEYRLCMLYTGLLYASLALFAVVCPFLIQDVLGYSPIAFGRIALLMGLAFFLGNFSNRLTLTMSSTLKITACFWLMLMVAISLLFLSLFIKLTIYSIVVPIFLLIYLSALVFPNYYAKSMALFPQLSGSANALMASSMALITGLLTAFAAARPANTLLPLALIYLGMAVICLIAHYTTGKANTL